MGDVIVVIGSGSIGQAIARRVSAGKQVLLADLQRENADAVARVMADAGFDVRPTTVDVTSRASVDALVEEAVALGDVSGIIHSAGVSPSNAPPEVIFKVDLYGAAVVLEAFGNVIARGGSGLVVSSQAGHRLGALPPEEASALATTLADKLLDLPMLQPDRVTDSLRAYQIAKRGSSLRVQAEAVGWARRGARLNAISPGIVVTPLSRKELNGPHSQDYRRMIEVCAAGRPGTPDEVGNLGALLMGPEGQFISGSDFLMDGGVTAAYWYGDLKPE
ncbi:MULTISPECIES: SDR family oxidoreductase [unclassified Wenzhouxiangella]|uniref:SDR family oxidoreductase n=1 Tax=unclassified Wenzhouxiangella TaxID=2613841 RepID=UPI000E32A231|nr:MULTISPECIES: SDR family oxidoreductase [unclassified Wenzhouxiangella]RFF28132.1 SDR family oxidoreductase [Wenzhouxiangella sp. 15181]RFP68070.1 SDR family oxidoreductase [Wenzhouxiangella sp. 15190]